MSLPGRITPTTNPLKRRRQEPVSCQFCRSKKLKCDRQHPCSNCLARGLRCDGQLQPSHHVSPPIDVQNESILTRLKRLEDIVLGSSQAQTSLGINQPPQPSPSLTQSRQATSPMACLSPASEYEEAVQSLEKMATCEDPWFSPRFKGPEFRISSLYQISSAHGMAQTQASYGSQDSRCFFIPRKEEASLLMDHYVINVDPLQHVVYAPHARSLMDSLYSRLEQGLPTIFSHMALVLSIFASSAALITGNVGNLQHLFRTSDPYQASTIWANAALEVLDLSRRTTSGSLEDVQTSIIMGFLLYHMEGFSPRCRFLFTGSVAISRDLCLHKLDAPTNQTSNPPNSIETEIKRRVWWHIVATDW